MLQTKKGFTIIELLLAMTVVSFLVIAIAIATIQMSSIMTKGKTMKELNIASRSINKEFTEKFNSTQAIWGWDGQAPSGGSNSSYVSDANGGAFCTGDFSYLWNTAQILNSNEREAPVRYAGGDPIRLVRVRDTARDYCTETRNWGNIPDDRNITSEIISAGEIDLMLYDIQFRARIDETSGQSLINIQYVLGTKSDNGQINANQCQPNSNLKDYCAINKFDLTVRTIGRR